MKDLNTYTSQILNPNLRAACEKLADYPDFFSHPGSVLPHHGYLGGLWIHTKEVLDFALHQAKLFPAVNKDVLIAATLWHDLAKIYDYKLVTYFNDQFGEIPKYYVFHSEENDENSSWKKVYIADADYKNQIHHITGSTAEFTHHALNCGVDRKTVNQIAHCIISHHGRKDWGSIKEPQTLEAMILHHADNLSAKFGPRKDK
jgi:3'-5' exoribonuclease